MMIRKEQWESLPSCGVLSVWFPTEPTRVNIYVHTSKQQVSSCGHVATATFGACGCARKSDAALPYLIIQKMKTHLLLANMNAGMSCHY